MHRYRTIRPKCFSERETLEPQSPLSLPSATMRKSFSCRDRGDGTGGTGPETGRVRFLEYFIRLGSHQEARMADVVRIQDRLSRMPRREGAWRETPAEILLFTGVRYERLTPATLPRKARGPAKPVVKDTASRN